MEHNGVLFACRGGISMKPDTCLFLIALFVFASTIALTLLRNLRSMHTTVQYSNSNTAQRSRDWLVSV